CGEVFDTRIEGCGDDGKRSALASAGDAEVGAVELRQTGEKIIGPYAAQVYALVVVAIPVVEFEEPVVAQRPRHQLCIDAGIHRDRYAMDADFEGDDSLFCQRYFAAIGTGAGTGNRSEEHT